MARVMPGGRALLVLGALLALAVVIAFRAGREAAALGPSELIAAVARTYEEETGAPGLCSGRPGDGRIWLVVACDGASGRVVYSVDRLGRITARDREGRPEA